MVDWPHDARSAICGWLRPARSSPASRHLKSTSMHRSISVNRSPINRLTGIGIPHSHAMTTDFGRRVKAARKYAKLTQKQLAARASMSQSNVSELETIAHESGRTMQLALACGVNAHWLATGEGEMLGPLQALESKPAWPPVQHAGAGGGDHSGASLAQQMSQVQQMIDPQEVQWELILQCPLPDRFTLAIRDDAMTVTDPPSMRPGDRAVFRSASSATPGQVVLIADRRGNVYIRRYTERHPGRWLAVARNESYADLDSGTDGLRILAVQTGVLWD